MGMTKFKSEQTAATKGWGNAGTVSARLVSRREQGTVQRCEHSRRVLLQVQARAEVDAAAEVQRDEAGVEIAAYRRYTEAMLRRYRKLRMGAGRVPSPMDREMFRGRMSHYKVLR